METAKKVSTLRPPELINLVKFVQAAFLLLNTRALTLLALLISAGAFGCVIYRPDWIRFAAACAFAAMVFWPCIRLESQTTKPTGATSNEES